MAKYFIEVEKGGRFEIELDDAAPVTAAAFKAFMEKNDGYTAHCLQGRFSGEEMYFSAPLGSTEQENNIRPSIGGVCFNPDPDWSAVCIYWGEHIADKKHYHNLFGHLKGDMKELTEVGTRIWQKGGENVVLRREE